MEVKFVMSINEHVTHVIVPSNPTRGPPTLSLLADNYQAGLLTSEVIVILFTRGPPYVQCTVY